MWYNYPAVLSVILCNNSLSANNYTVGKIFRRILGMFWLSLLIILFMLAASFLTGALFTALIPGNHGAGFKTVSGFLAVLVLYRITDIIVGLFSRYIDMRTWIWLGLVLIVCAASVILNFMSAKDYVLDVVREFSIYGIKDRFKWQYLLLAAAVASQIICVLNFYVPDITSDEYFLAAVVERWDTNDIRIADPYTGSGETVLQVLPGNGYITMIAGLSRLFSLHPAVFVHIPWAVLIVLLAYIASAVAAELLLDEKKDISLFLTFLTILNMFAAYSANAAGFIMYAAVWQGKAVFALVAVPALICYAVMAVDRGKKLKMQGGRSNWIYAACASAASIVLTPMGAFFAPVILSCVTAYYAIHDRSVKNIIYCVLCFIPSILYLILTRLL